MLIQSRAIALIFLFSCVISAGQSKAQSNPQSRNSGHQPMSKGVWPSQVHFWTREEMHGKYERRLNNELRFEWFLDRGEADLRSVEGSTYEDPKILPAYEVRVRLTYNNGNTQDFPTRVGTMDPREFAALYPGPLRDDLLVSAILPIRNDVKLIQLFDHYGVLAWEARPKPVLFASNRGNPGVKAGEDYTPSPAFQRLLRDDPVRKKRQDDRINQGMYAPREIRGNTPHPIVW